MAAQAAPEPQPAQAAAYAPPTADYQDAAAASYQPEPTPVQPATAPAPDYEPPAGPPAENGSGSFTDGADGPYVTPLVRKLATEHGVDLAAVAGTGVGGRIRKQDVLDAARVARGPEGGIAAAPQAVRRRPRGSAPLPRRLRPPGSGTSRSAGCRGPSAERARGGRRSAASLRGTTEPMSRLRRSSRRGWSSRCRSRRSSPPSSRSTSPRSRGCGSGRRPTSRRARASSCRSCRSSRWPRSRRSRRTRSVNA